ncbi:hypothetical protein A2961_04160 [Candidatus Woesebacteria bacterium RIFCSPLOWO2_01_FULL_39_21]|uniref:Uncharacterized protein n=1 Tax=Candidatus Woesebacteria bacterium RIFCSPLOWO2_01_FULL_39_21 TaxID=1802519 RepID=A0A1F8BBW9_9BACT|nr:MAG: hypothetical protein A2961_04160 [Candidatus Woesebacteria bacterium RIFCSPLOWO2_01_FULL_39_21]
MTLTEEDKKRIEEEEKYRAEVRKELKEKSEKPSAPPNAVSQKQESKLVTFFKKFVLLIVGVSLSILLLKGLINSESLTNNDYGNNPAIQEKTSQPSNKTTGGNEILVKEGKFSNNKYSYQILKKSGDKNYYAIFTPFLADDTQVVTLAIMTVVSDVYGSDVFLNNKPNVSEYEGFTFIQIPYKGENIVVTPVSENRQIHSIIMWKE